MQPRRRTRWRSAAAALLLLAAVPAADATTIADWNVQWLDAIRATGGPPGPIARGGAMLHTAMYNSVNALTGSHQSYHFDAGPVTGGLPEVAAAQAARDVLVHLFPSRTAIFDSALASQLSIIPDSPGKTASIQLGQAAATSIITLRAADGSDAVVIYPDGTNPGEWRRTGPDFSNPATPQWPGVTPFTMISGDQFRPALPDGATDMAQLLASQAYTDSYNDVMAKGARFGSTRTAEEEIIASFWANDRDGTYKPPGQLNAMAQVLATQNNLSLEDEARLFALLNLALADAGIVAWDAKYATDVDLWRPVTGIQLGDTDGNPNTLADPTWTPWSDDPTVNGFSPPFPAFISGHSTFGAAASAVFREFFGTDLMTFTLGTDDPFFTTPEFRTFNSFTQAALENGRSRVYLGVHWQIDADFGYASGTEVGAFVATNFLQAIIPEPSLMALICAGMATLLLPRRRRA